MDQITRTGYRHHPQCSFFQLCPDTNRQSWSYVIRQRGQSNTGKIELQAIQSIKLHRIHRLFQARANKSPGEYAELHQTPPSTSESFTFFPDSTDLAIATRARTLATPSSMFAPSCGRPCKIASAKFSICNL